MEHKVQNTEDFKMIKKTNLSDRCLRGLSYSDSYKLQEQHTDLFKQDILMVIFDDSLKSVKWTILKAIQNCSFT